MQYSNLLDPVNTLRIYCCSLLIIAFFSVDLDYNSTQNVNFLSKLFITKKGGPRDYNILYWKKACFCFELELMNVIILPSYKEYNENCLLCNEYFSPIKKV